MTFCCLCFPQVVQKRWVRWETKWSFDGKLYQEYSYQKLSKYGNWFSSYSQNCQGCFGGDTVYLLTDLYVLPLIKIKNNSINVNKRLMKYESDIFYLPSHDNYLHTTDCSSDQECLHHHNDYSILHTGSSLQYTWSIHSSINHSLIHSLTQSKQLIYKLIHRNSKPQKESAQTRDRYGHYSTQKTTAFRPYLSHVRWLTTKKLLWGSVDGVRQRGRPPKKWTDNQTCNKSSNSQVQVQVPYPQVQVHLKRASPSPSPSPLQIKASPSPVGKKRTCKQFYPIPVLFLLLLLSKTLYHTQKRTNP